MDEWDEQIRVHTARCTEKKSHQYNMGIYRTVYFFYKNRHWYE